MEAEIIFSGLCAFHNVHDDEDEGMPEPSVILVRTDDATQDIREAMDGVRTPSDLAKERLFSPAVNAQVRNRWQRPRREIDRVRKEDTNEGPEQASDVHIAHISFNSNEVRVNEEAEGLFQPVPFAPGFRYLPLNGVEIEIMSDTQGAPDVDESYDRLVVQKDHYWPEAANEWNRDFVPFRGGQPKRSAVVGFMRFGRGRISAGNLSPVPWEFPPDTSGHQLVGTFAEEVVYDKFPQNGEVVLQLRDVETRIILRRIRFSPLMPDARKLTLFIGNNDLNDIDNAVQRRIPLDVRDNVHFKFLNRVSSVKDPGRTPRVVRNSTEVPDADQLGGVSTGPCGPVGSNGGVRTS